MSESDKLELQVRRTIDKQFEAFKDSLDRSLAHTKWGAAVLATGAITVIYFLIGDSAADARTATQVMKTDARAAIEDLRSEVQGTLKRIQVEAERAVEERTIQYYVDKKLIEKIEAQVDEIADKGVDRAKKAMNEAVESALEIERVRVVGKAVDELRSSVGEITEYQKLFTRIESVEKKVLSGKVTVGKGPGGTQPKLVIITFPRKFEKVPDVVATPLSVEASDVFTATIREVSTTGCKIYVGRVGVDNNIGHWGQNLQLAWIAWAP